MVGGGGGGGGGGRGGDNISELNIAQPMDGWMFVHGTSFVRLQYACSVVPIIGSAIGYQLIVGTIQHIGCLSDSTYRYRILEHAL